MTVVLEDFVKQIEKLKGIFEPFVAKEGVVGIDIATRSDAVTEEIADYLDQKCADIDALIADKERFLEELENYKKSVIYEYVTGKKEVPACQ